MPTIQQQLNQLKADKATLNTMLNTMGVETTGSETFTELAPLVGKIVTDPILQDKSITITENGTTNIVADEGYDGLNNVTVTTDVPTSGGEPVVEPDYITAGLVAWWEGEDNFDANNHWNSRVGTDYITVNNQNVGNMTTNPPICSGKGIFNNGVYMMKTQQDYCKNSYTIQAVFYTELTDATVCAMNVSNSPVIGYDKKNNRVKFSNAGNPIYEKEYKNMPKKKINASLNLLTAPVRGGSAKVNLLGSVNGENWFSITSSSSLSYTDKGSYITVLSYYSTSYPSEGTGLYSLRVYNRKLSEDELKHNYEIDKARFNLDK